MKNSRILLFASALTFILALGLLASCQAPQPSTTPQASPAAEIPAKELATKPTTPAKPPVAVLQIVPVAANPSDPHVINASLPGTTSTVATGATGLPNVSVGVPVALKGRAIDPKDPAKTYTWALSRPSTSKASLDRKDGELAKFIPDVPGIYKIDLIVGNDAGKSPMASVQVRADTYVGIGRGQCNNCHRNQVAEWSKTGHAVIFEQQIDGGANPKDSHYGEGCIRCHTTGYYIGIENGGFADIQAKSGWKFPSLSSIQSGKGNWEAVPEALKNLANIQCEACHGPAAQHVSTGTPMTSSLDEGVCNVCHNGGGHHVKGEMFKNSKHGDKTAQSWNYPIGPERQDCIRCHSGAGYMSFLKNPTEVASWNNSKQTVTCAVCHDSHSDANPFQLRIVGKPVEVKGVANDLGLSATCVECHNARTTAADAVKGVFPHYSAAAEMLNDTGGVDYGQQLPNSVHSTIIGKSPITDPSDKEGKAKLFGGNVPGPCVTCHMWPTPEDAKDPNRFKVGDHSFNMADSDGKFDYTAACQGCHSGLNGFNVPAKADYDGNGRVEGVQTELAGLLNILQNAIAESGVKPVKGHPYFDRDDVGKANDKAKNAVYNYLFVRGLEGADGKASAIHNFKRSVALLQLSYKDLKGRDVPNATLAYK